jgi:hypothetical protein
VVAQQWIFAAVVDRLTGVLTGWRSSHAQAERKTYETSKTIVQGDYWDLERHPESFAVVDQPGDSQHSRHL